MSVYRAAKIMLCKFVNRNRCILGEVSTKAIKNRVNLHAWSFLASEGKENLGDYLSETVVAHMARTGKVDLDDKVNKTRHLYAIGSILQAGYQNATVWGSGFLEDPFGSRLQATLQGSFFRKLDIRAVRGPKTREALLKLGHDCPEVYGDPGILMPQIYMPADIQKQKPYCVINHYLDNTGDSSCVSMITKDYIGVINQICASEKVISSSLHGIILAEAYGVPAVLYLPECTKQHLSLFKYQDYYYGTGRKDFPIASTIEEAIHMQGCPLPELFEQQKKLAQTFPFDLWA